ncbi:hypothetical protein [Stappia sp.]|nr:hypothetical protein [Stappia sp.]
MTGFLDTPAERLMVAGLIVFIVCLACVMAWCARELARDVRGRKRR